MFESLNDRIVKVILDVSDGTKTVSEGVEEIIAISKKNKDDDDEQATGS